MNGVLETIGVGDTVIVKAGINILISYVGVIHSFCAAADEGGYILLDVNKESLLPIAFKDIKSLSVVKPWEERHKTAAEQAKAVGLKSLKEVERLTCVSWSTLNRWHTTKPKLFAVLLEGCKVAKQDGLIKSKGLGASEYAKKAGLSSLAEMSRIIDVKPQTLNLWNKEKPLLFVVLVAGSLVIKQYQDNQKNTGLT